MAVYYVGNLACDSNYLEHHGIKGQKWGVRRYQNPDGTWTEAGKQRHGIGSGGGDKLDRLYKRQSKKLQKLRDRADIKKQTENIGKYNRRAGIGLAGAAVGAGAAATAYGMQRYLAPIAEKALKSKWKEIDQNLYDSEDRVRALWDADKQAYDKNHNWTGKGYSQETWDKIDKEMASFHERDNALMTEKNGIRDKFNKNSAIRKAVAIGGGAVAGVSLGFAAYNKIQASLAKKRTTEIGHNKAVQKAKDQLAKMEKMFADTPYSELVKKQKNIAIK